MQFQSISHFPKMGLSVHVNRQILFSIKRNLFPNKSQKKDTQTPTPTRVGVLLTPCFFSSLRLQYCRTTVLINKLLKLFKTPLFKSDGGNAISL